MPLASGERSAYGIGAAIIVAALLAQWPTFDRSAVTVDEGQLLAIASRLLAGEVLYRDIYTGIFPGIYYFTALLLGLFGEDVLVVRSAQVVINATTVWLLWRIGRRVVRSGWMLLAPLLYLALVVFSFPTLTMVNYSSLSMLFLLAAFDALLRACASRRNVDAILCGVWLGIAGLVKQNFGGLGGIALLIGCVWHARASGRPSAEAWARCVWLSASAGAVGAAALAALALMGAAPDFLRQTLLVIGESQLDAFNDPLPPLFGAHPDSQRFVFVYTPSALFNYLVRGEKLFGLAMGAGLRSSVIRAAYGGTYLSLLCGGLFLFVGKARSDAAERAAGGAVVIFSCVMFLGIFPSAIWSHLAFVLPPVLVLFAWIAARGVELVRHHPLLERFWLVSHGLLALLALALWAQISRDLSRWYSLPLGLPRGTLRVEATQKTLLAGATRYLQRCAPPGQPVFVAPDMPLLYFLADRRNPTPYDLVIPGAIDDALIVERLEATQTRCAVYNPSIYMQFEPFEKLYPRTARYLEQRFESVVAFRASGAEWHGLQRRPPRVVR